MSRNLKETEKTIQYLFNLQMDMDTDPPTVTFGRLGKVPGVGYGDVELEDYPYEQYDIDYSVNPKGNCIYIGGNLDTSALDTATNWRITRYWYDEENNVIKKKTKTGAWSDRVALFS